MLEDGFSMLSSAIKAQDLLQLGPVVWHCSGLTFHDEGGLLGTCFLFQGVENEFDGRSGWWLQTSIDEVLIQFLPFWISVPSWGLSFFAGGMNSSVEEKTVFLGTPEWSIRPLYHCISSDSEEVDFNWVAERLLKELNITGDRVVD